VFNVGTGRSFSLLEMLDALRQLLNVDVKPIFQPARVGDVRESLADITLSRTLLGYEPRVSFHEGLKKTVEFYRSQIKA
jgi:UDP-glucose 4-epimerase